jgi:predicted aspartyl protease
MKNFKYLILLLCCILASSICFATPEYFQYDQRAFDEVVLPFTFSKKLPVVIVKIQGKNVNLIVDTGAPNVTIALKPSVLKDINVRYLENKNQSLDVYGQAHEEIVYEIPKLTIGKLKLVNLIAREELRNFVPADGIIGNRVLKEFYLLFDYKESKVTFFSKGKYPLELNLDQWQKVHFEYDDYDKKVGIILIAQIAELKRDLKLCLDSGSSAFDLAFGK